MAIDGQITIADLIGNVFGNDGLNFEAEMMGYEVCLPEVCGSFAISTDVGYEKEKFTFMDGSIITLCGGAWDKGFECCFGWVGCGGHSVECTASDDAK